MDDYHSGLPTPNGKLRRGCSIVEAAQKPQTSFGLSPHCLCRVLAHRHCSKVLMQRQKSMGTVRRAVQM
jgi:hypothetical protein